MEVEQAQFNRPAYASAAVVPGAPANTAEIAISVFNLNGKLTGGGFFFLFLSDSPTGVGLTAVTASGNVNVKAAAPTNGADVAVLVAKKALMVQPRISIAPGTYTLWITDAAKTAFKISVQIGGVTQVVATLTAANYS